MKIKFWKKAVIVFLLFIFGYPLMAALPTQMSNFASPAYWGMAHSGGAVADVSNAYWLNPALNPYNTPWSITVNEAFLPGMGIFISELSGHYRVADGHVVTSGLNFENYGSFDQRDINGTLEGEFTAAQYQYFIGYGYRMSDHFSAGAQLVIQGDRINESRETYTYLRYGLSYTFGKRDNVLAFSGATNGLDNTWRTSFSHELEYLPLRLNIDFRWYGDDWDPDSFYDSETSEFIFDTAARYFIEKFTLGFYIKAGENFRIMSGFDLARLNLASNTFGLDSIISGLALGGKYKIDQLEISLGLYHYANFTTMTALGISYSGK
ncbi:MAG: hypothetical protein U9O95_03140 [Candidatus Marinimicrobia bacterium]|nr:hypothetical protein [Candidatus Neomarinimicrobiota bacterium]